jgi:hypothetical protein
MDTLTIKIKKDYALRILEDLQTMEAISFVDSEKKSIPKRTFSAMSISTKGFIFNREEANER